MSNAAMHTFQEIPQDTVALRLSATDHVKVDLVKVNLTVKLINGGDDARGKILASLRQIVDAQWRLPAFARTTEAGLERVEAGAAARVKEKDLDGIASKIHELNGRGMEITLESLDYSPTREQIEEASVKLRAAVYAKAAAEVKVLNASIGPSEVPNRMWRVGLVRFENSSVYKPSSNVHTNTVLNNGGARGVQGAQGVMGTQGMQGAVGAQGSDDVDMLQKVSISADVNLYRLAV